jgi:hypothetical protein
MEQVRSRACEAVIRRVQPKLSRQFSTTINREQAYVYSNWVNSLPPMLKGIQKFARYNTGQVSNFESSHPQLGLRIVYLVQIRHQTGLFTRTANPKQLLPFLSDPVLHKLQALGTEIIESKPFHALHS